MNISGIQKFTLLDYPDKTACIVFTPGCNLRCGYCHNKEFVLPELLQKIKTDFIPEEIFFKFLEKRKKLLEGVVVTGGEPTIHKDLPNFLKKIKEMGFLVKLDTNGNNPEMLQKIIQDDLVDYIAMDMKTSLETYAKHMGKNAKKEAIEKSISLTKNFKNSEFRTTLLQELHSAEILKQMAKELVGAKKLFLQKFRPKETLNPLFQTFHPFSDKEMNEIKAIFEPFVENVTIRV